MLTTQQHRLPRCPQTGTHLEPSCVLMDWWERKLQCPPAAAVQHPIKSGLASRVVRTLSGETGGTVPLSCKDHDPGGTRSSELPPWAGDLDHGCFLFGET